MNLDSGEHSGPSPLFGLFLASLAGVFLAAFTSGPPWVPALLALGSVAGWTVPRLRTVSLAALCLAAFWLHGGNHFHPLHPADIRNLTSQEARTHQVTGWVSRPPESRTNTRGEIRYEFPVVLTHMHTPEGPVSARGTIWTVVPASENSPPSDGDILTFHAFIRSPATPGNPGQFDYAAHLRSRGIHLEARADPATVRVEGRKTRLLQDAAGWFRNHMLATLRLGLEDDAEIWGLMAAMLFGYRDGVAADLRESFRVTGTLHLFAVSGQNIGVLCGLLLVVLQMIGVVRWRWAWTLIPVVFLFCLATGMEPSAKRAFVMSALVLVAWWIGRPVRPLNILGAAGLLLLAIDPHEALQAGFQLSFAVVFALMVLARPLYDLAYLRIRPDPWIPRRLLEPWRLDLDRAGRAVCIVASACAAAWLGSLPFSVGMFHIFSPVGLPANLCLAPLSALVLVVSAGSVACGLFLPVLSSILNQVNWLALHAVIFCVQTLAALPGGYTYVRTPGTGCDRDTVRITLLDVPRAVPTWIETIHGAWLLDTGNPSAWKWVVDPFRQQAGINRADGLFLTQATLAANGAALEAVAALRPRWIAEGGWRGRSPAHHSWLTKLEESGIPKRFYRAGETIPLDPQTRIDVLWPSGAWKPKRAEDQGLVLLIRAHGRSVLWAGDISPDTEQAVLDLHPGLRTDVLVQGQHSEGPNLSPPWLRQLRPRTVVRPALDYGIDNSLDSPYWNLARELDITTLRMEKTGAIRLVINPENIHIHPHRNPILHPPLP